MLYNIIFSVYIHQRNNRPLMGVEVFAQVSAKVQGSPERHSRPSRVHLYVESGRLNRPADFECAEFIAITRSVYAPACSGV